MSRLPVYRFAVAVSIVAAVCVTPIAKALAQAPNAFQQAWQAGTPASVTGVVTILYSDDFANKRSEIVHMIRDEKTGRTYRLRFERNTPQNLRSGMVVSVSGRARASEIYLMGDTGGLVTVQQPTVETLPAPVTGDQKTLLIVANLTDAIVTSSVSQISDLMFTSPLNRSVDDLYREMSSGQLSFSGTVVGPYNLNRASTDPCDLTAMSDEADAAAAQAVDVSAYQRKVYVFPPAGCGGAGIAQFGMTPSRAWVFVSEIADIYAHELGHNLGMHHASTADNEYGDNTEIMGLARNRLRPLAAAHKYQMGWVTGSQVAVINQEGLYDVAPLELPAGASSLPQVLRIPKPDSSDFYYVGYRRAIGFGTEMYDMYLDRLSVHLWSGNASRTYFLASVGDGETFTDPVNGFAVTQVSHTDGSAVARVQPGQGCGASAPTLTLSPRDQSGPAGTTPSYEIALVNNDAPTCAAASFMLQPGLPSGWASSLAATTLQVAPGGTAQTTLTIMPPVNVPVGTYSLGVTTSDVLAPAHSASAAGTYAVTSTCLRSVPTLALSPASQSASPGTRRDYALAVINRDGAACPPSTFNVAVAVPAGWTGTMSSGALTLAPGASLTVTASVTSPVMSASGTYPVGTSVSDAVNAGHQQSANGSYLVQAGDTTAPTAPAGLVGSVRRKLVTLAWLAASDNIGVTGYRVSRNGVVVALTPNVSWIDPAAPPGVSTYSVVAYDAAGNLSATSNSVSVNLGGKK